MLASTYQVGRYGTWVTWESSGAMAERAEWWLTRVPKVALSSSTVAGESHPEQLALPKKCWVSLTWTPATLSCTRQVCMGVLKMLRHLKQCWALMGVQLHLVTSAKCFLLSKMWMLLSPSPLDSLHTESTTGKANKMPVCKRKPAIFTGNNPQMETQISVSPFFCIKKASEGPGSGTNTCGGYF